MYWYVCLSGFPLSDNVTNCSSNISESIVISLYITVSPFICTVSGFISVPDFVTYVPLIFPNTVMLLSKV